MIDYKTILANGGATVNKHGEAVTLKTGYQVSKQDEAVIAVADFTQEAVKNIVDTLKQRGDYAGFWVDAGKVYCDISKRHSTKKAALAAGKAYNQISIWDWKKQQAVYC